MSVRQNIITSVKSTFQNITILNGYNTDFGQKLYEWKHVDVASADMDCIILRDNQCLFVDPEEPDDNVQNRQWKKLTLQVIVVTSGKTSSETLRRVVADIYKAIGTNPTWDGNAVRTEVDGDEMELDQLNKIFGATIITVNITYVTEKWGD